MDHEPQYKNGPRNADGLDCRGIDCLHNYANPGRARIIRAGTGGVDGRGDTDADTEGS